MFRRDKSEVKNSIILMSLRKKTEIVRKILNFDHDDDEEED